MKNVLNSLFLIEKKATLLWIFQSENKQHDNIFRKSKQAVKEVLHKIQYKL